MVGISDQGALSQLISIITNNRSGLGDAISRIASGSRLINASARTRRASPLPQN